MGLHEPWKDLLLRFYDKCNKMERMAICENNGVSSQNDFINMTPEQMQDSYHLKCARQAESRKRQGAAQNQTIVWTAAIVVEEDTPTIILTSQKSNGCRIIQRTQREFPSLDLVNTAPPAHL
jgi:hypothetical protein